MCTDRGLEPHVHDISIRGMQILVGLKVNYPRCRVLRQQDPAHLEALASRNSSVDHRKWVGEQKIPRAIVISLAVLAYWTNTGCGAIS